MEQSIYQEIFKDPRTFNQILISMIALRIGTTFAFGHLTSLRKETHAVWHVLAFIALPTLPLANLITGFWQSCKIAWEGTDGEWKDLRYLAAVAFQVRATDLDDRRESRPLSELSYMSVQCEGAERDWKWIGRLVVLAFLLAQSLAATIIWIRRLSHSFPDEHPDPSELKELLVQFGVDLSPDYDFTSVTVFDTWNGAYAIGGLSSVLTSIGIMCINQKWRYIRQPQRQINLSIFDRPHTELTISYTIFWAVNYKAIYRTMALVTGFTIQAFEQKNIPLRIWWAYCLSATIFVFSWPVVHCIPFYFHRLSMNVLLEDVGLFTMFYSVIAVFISVLDLRLILSFQNSGYCYQPFVLWKDDWSDKTLSF